MSTRRRIPSRRTNQGRARFISRTELDKASVEGWAAIDSEIVSQKASDWFRQYKAQLLQLVFLGH